MGVRPNLMSVILSIPIIRVIIIQFISQAVREMFENAWFTYESGQAWCEAAYKYQTLPMVAEFANTRLFNF